jgi:hydrogenase maturation protease
MTLDKVKKIAAAVLYEGYILYPYRASAIKNQQRWTFGGVFPKDYGAGDSGDPCAMQTECLLRGDHRSRIDVRIRFLHLLTRETIELHSDADPACADAASMEIGGARTAPWEEAAEREVVAPVVTIKELLAAPMRIEFAFPGQCEQKFFRQPEGGVAIQLRTFRQIEGALEIGAEPVGADAFRLTVGIENLTKLEPAERERREKAQRRAFASTHMILQVRDGAFVSLMDPPEELCAAAAQCENRGTWPVLAGDEEARDTILSSPIILYDFPQIAEESPVDLFDGTEIDEILILRILAMTDAEKREMAATDERARALLERIEALGPDEFARLHGALRMAGSGAPEEKSASAALSSDGVWIGVGDQVRLRPKAGGDIMDLALANKLAVVEAIERDYEDRIHVAVTLLDDPGRDLGLDRFPGHRFFFSLDEIESFAAGGLA